jgi:hypothetical protein
MAKLDVGDVVVNLDRSLRGPSHTATVGETPVLSPEEARAVIDSVDITTPAGLRDRAR